jgi:phospholipid-translocating ATPase
MILAELFSLALYIISLFFFRQYFGESIQSEFGSQSFTFNFLLTDWEFIWTTDFLSKVSAITAVSCVPLYILKFLRQKCSPPSYVKLS